MAAPHVAGAAALVLGATPTATPADGREHADRQRRRRTRSPTPAPARRTACSSCTAHADRRPRRRRPRRRPRCTAATNGTDIPIPDLGDRRRRRSPSRAARATPRRPPRSTVNIVHTYIGDLVVDLIAPERHRLQPAQPRRRQRRQHQPDLHREPLLRGRPTGPGSCASATPRPPTPATSTPGRCAWATARRRAVRRPTAPTSRSWISRPWSRRSTSTGCAGNASATAKVEVHLVHTFRGDLVVSLIAPDGSSYVLQQPGRRQRRQPRPDVHREPLVRAGQRDLEAARPGRRGRRQRLHQHLDDHPVRPAPSSAALTAPEPGSSAVVLVLHMLSATLTVCPGATISSMRSSTSSERSTPSAAR